MDDLVRHGSTNPEKRTSASKRTRGRANGNKVRVEDLVLVPECSLFFRFLPTNSGYPTLLLERETRIRLRKQFRRAFENAWARLDNSDEKVLLDYWAPGPPYRGPDCIEMMTPNTWPLIQVVQVVPGPEEILPWVTSGHRLDFAFSLVAGTPSMLPAAIAKSLARVLWRAKGRYWQLFTDMIERPMDKYEMNHPKAIDHWLGRQHAKLEAEFLLVRDAETAELLARWGFGPENSASADDAQAGAQESVAHHGLGEPQGRGDVLLPLCPDRRSTAQDLRRRWRGGGGGSPRRR